MQMTWDAPASAKTLPADSEWQLATKTNFKVSTLSFRKSVSMEAVTLTDSPL